MSNKPRKSDLEPITLEELENMPGLSGLLSFLKVPPGSPSAQPSTAEPVLAQQTRSEPSTSQPTIAQPTLAEPPLAEPEKPQPWITQPQEVELSIAGPNMSEPNMAQPEMPQPRESQTKEAEPALSEMSLAEPNTAQPTVTDIKPAQPTMAEPLMAKPNETFTISILPINRIPPNARIHVIRQVQDGLSKSELSVYQVLYRKSGEGKSPVRISFNELARESSLSRNAIRYLVPALKEKLAILELEPPVPQLHQGGLYEVFSFKRILANWEKAGILGAYRARAMVALVTSANLASAKSGPEPGASLAQPALPAVYKEESQRVEEESSKLLLLLDWLPEADLAFCRKLLSAARAKNPEITPEDIAYRCYTRLKRARIHTSATGFLLSLYT